MSSTHRPGHDERNDAGFTLVELLVATALLTLLSVLLVGSLRFGLRAWDRGITHADHIEQITLTQGLIRRIVEDAYPFFSPGDRAQGEIDFDGAEHSLRLLASKPRALGGGGRSRFLVSLERRDGHSDLVITSDPELANDAAMSARKVLLADVQSVELAYFGKGRSDRVAVWRPRWTGETILPQLVRVHVQFAPGDPRHWPELSIQPRIAVDVGCDYDPLTKQCRGR